MPSAKPFLGLLHDRRSARPQIDKPRRSNGKNRPLALVESAFVAWRPDCGDEIGEYVFCMAMRGG
jgi:hypothetical protein